MYVIPAVLFVYILCRHFYFILFAVSPCATADLSFTMKWIYDSQDERESSSQTTTILENVHSVSAHSERTLPLPQYFINKSTAEMKGGCVFMPTPHNLGAALSVASTRRKEPPPPYPTPPHPTLPLQVEMNKWWQILKRRRRLCALVPILHSLKNVHISVHAQKKVPPTSTPTPNLIFEQNNWRQKEKSEPIAPCAPPPSQHQRCTGYIYIYIFMYTCTLPSPPLTQQMWTLVKFMSIIVVQFLWTLWTSSLVHLLCMD